MRTSSTISFIVSFFLLFIIGGCALSVEGIDGLKEELEEINGKVDSAVSVVGAMTANDNEGKTDNNDTGSDEQPDTTGCQLDTDCEDHDPCTKDICKSDGTCHYYTLEECLCWDDEDCDNGYPCTEGFCVRGRCQTRLVPDLQCCEDDMQCNVDDDPCHIGRCEEHICTYVLYHEGCCTTHEDCDDDDPSTVDSCPVDGQDGVSSTCSHERMPCESDEECADDDYSTIDSCEEGYCTYERIFCHMDSACADDDPCTVDSCKPIEGSGSEKQYCHWKPSHFCNEDGGCIAEYREYCNDGNPCTVNWCEPVERGSRCRFTSLEECPIPCESNEDCDGGDSCTVGQCKSDERGGSVCHYELKPEWECIQ